MTRSDRLVVEYGKMEVVDLSLVVLDQGGREIEVDREGEVQVARNEACERGEKGEIVALNPAPGHCSPSVRRDAPETARKRNRAESGHGSERVWARMAARL